LASGTTGVIIDEAGDSMQLVKLTKEEDLDERRCLRPHKCDAIALNLCHLTVSTEKADDHEDERSYECK
jgi:hypothetical protein